MTDLDHDGLLAKKLAHPEWIWNRSDTHVILGVPESPEAFKTIVEPGNTFSPGFRSYAVSIWLVSGGRLFAPEQMPIGELAWRYADGYLPILESRWSAGELTVSSTLFTDGDVGTRDIRTHLTVTVENTSSHTIDAELLVVFRSFGPAGGPVRSLEFDGKDVVINGAVQFTFADTPDSAGAVSAAASGDDIGSLLHGGRRVSSLKVEDASGWASGYAGFRFALGPGDGIRRSGTAFVHAGISQLSWLARSRGEPFASPDSAGFRTAWLQRLSVELDLPDRRFTEAFHAQLAYLYMSTVGVEPRISPISYPLWWLRDGAYVLSALEKGGFDGWVDRAIRNAARREPFGGFGSEGDGPGQLIWLISEHYLMTRDRAFLEAHFADIDRDVQLIERMRSATEPVFGRTEVRTPQMMLDPSADLMAAPSKEGLIIGRMDHHFPRFWVNGWAIFALRRAALCAAVLGRDATPYKREAASLLDAIDRQKPKHFGDNDRDLTGSIWPTGWADPNDPIIRKGFSDFWNRVRCPAGTHVPEPEWTYFEAGQAHNYIMLGERDKAWVSIEMFLSHHAAQGLYTYHEGIGDENSSLQWQRSRGWNNIPHVTPHGWTAAELFLLLRDCLAREDGDSLVVGSGVPASWLHHDFSIARLPTHFGRVEISYNAAARRVRVTTERPAGTVVSAFTSDVSVEVAVP